MYNLLTNPRADKCQENKYDGNPCENKFKFIAICDKKFANLNPKMIEKLIEERIYETKLVCGTHALKHAAVKLTDGFIFQETMRHSSLSILPIKGPNKFGAVACSYMFPLVKTNQIYKCFVHREYTQQTKDVEYYTYDLSPMKFKDIQMSSDNLSRCQNLHNFKLAHEIFDSEMDSTGRLMPVFYDRFIETYNSELPLASKIGTSCKNEPVAIFWRDQRGSHIVDTISGRQFFCAAYERSVSLCEDFEKIIKLHWQGINLVIYGTQGKSLRDIDLVGTIYDSIDQIPIEKLFELHYLDSRYEFGPEMILAAMIMLPPHLRPWTIHKTFAY